MRKRLCRCPGCPAVTSSGDYCWTCWANRKDSRDCLHTPDARIARHPSTGILSRYNNFWPTDPGWA